MKELFRRIHTEKFRWYDEFLVIFIFSFILTIVCQGLGLAVMNAIARVVPLTDAFGETFQLYFSTIGGWIFLIPFLYLVKHRRPILKAIGPKPKGNNFKWLLFGLLIGFGLNFFCAVIAMFNRDIHITLAHVEPVKILLLLFAVFVQSSSEELIDRAYVYQTLVKGYRNKWVAIIGNALMFSLMHGFNPGVTPLALANIFFSGLLFSLMVYYFDSLWCAFGIHTGWNFTQSILLGLPNSGIVVPYSIFELDTATAANSFVYNVMFGIEGTIFSTILLAAACVVTYVLGKKRNRKPIDVWADYPARPGAENA